MGDETNPDIGMELQAPNAPPPDRSQNPMSKFFADPKNIATALIFGAALAQPRQYNNDAIGTLLQRAAGAAMFRGGLEAGAKKQELQREQTAFERAQAEKVNQLNQERIDVANRQAGADEQRNANMLTGDALQSQTQIAVEAMRGKLEKDIRGMKPELSEGDYIKMAMDMVPHLLTTMEFDQNTTPAQKIQLATNEALKSVMLSKNLLRSGGQVVRDPQTGQLFVDDGKGNRTQVPGTQPIATKPQPAPIPKPTPPAPIPNPSVPPGFVGPALDTFAPSLGERLVSSLRGGLSAPTSEERDFPTQSFFPQYLQLFREGMQRGGNYDREAIGMLGRLGDYQLQTMGMAPNEISTLRQLQKGL